VIDKDARGHDPIAVGIRLGRLAAQLPERGEFDPDHPFLRLDHDHHGRAPDGQAGKHWLLIRRNHKTGELAFYRCYTPRPAPLLRGPSRCGVLTGTPGISVKVGLDQPGGGDRGEGGREAVPTDVPALDLEPEMSTSSAV
jgi:hypothetical protein